MKMRFNLCDGFTNNLNPEPGNLGKEETGPKDPSKRQRVEVNLNSFQADSGIFRVKVWVILGSGFRVQDVRG